MIIDLRSDTVTKPTKEMRKAMMKAEVGDDVFNEDPSVIELENKVAEMFNMDAALFCPSGTMANQMAIKLNTNPLDEIICHDLSHIKHYELGGHGFHSGVSLKTFSGNEGRLTPEDIVNNINPDYDWSPITKLVWLENTCNKAGGTYYTYAQMEAITHVCKEHQLRLHLDGARIFNALVELDLAPNQIGRLFNSISFCLSKGLGAPIGSMLVGSKQMIRDARRLRKAMGGGMRQVGFLAAAGIYALDNHVERLKEDHRRARALGQVISQQSFIEKMYPVVTNIIKFDVKEPHTANSILAQLANYNIKGGAHGKSQIRLVTHLDFTDAMLQKTIKAFEEMSSGKAPSKRPKKAAKKEPNINFGRYSDAYKSDAQYDSLDEAIKLFDKKEYLEAYQHFFEYLQDTNMQNVHFERSNGHINFEIIQGSKKIQGQANNEYVKAETSVVKANKLGVKFMRKLMEMNYGMHYNSFALDDENVVKLTFTTQVSDGSPEKLYFALKEMGIYADKHDDLLINEYASLKAIQSAPTRSINDAEKTVKFNYIQQWIKATLTEVENLDTNIFAKGISYMLLNLAYKIDYLIVPQSLLAEMVERIEVLYFSNDGATIIEKNRRMIREFEKVLEWPQKRTQEEMYQVKSTFGVSARALPVQIKTLIKDLLEDYAVYRDQNKPLIANSILEYITQYSLYHYGLPSVMRSLFHIIIRCINADYFKELGFTPLYYPSKKELNKSAIKALLADIQTDAQKQYPKFRLGINQLNYSKLRDFILNLFVQIIQANFDTPPKQIKD